MNTAIRSKSPTIRRILREAQELASTPSPDYTAVPLESDLFEWHFTLRGPPSSCYSDGIYHGRISLPATYPLRPPNFRFVTPNGRFEVNREICLSISGHHEETWQPAWGVRTSLVALRSFMETSPEGQLGGLSTTEDRRKMLAAQSRSFKCAACGKSNADIMVECEERAREAEEAEGHAAAEVEVPKELSMGFRDEMEKAKAADGASAGGGVTVAPALGGGNASGTSTSASGHGGGSATAAGRSDSMDSESAALAEGFVKTAEPTATTTTTQAYPRARPGQGAPTPTPTTATTAPAQTGTQQEQDLRQQLQQQRQQRHENEIAWIDKIILVVACLLAAMMLRMLMS